MAPLDMLAAYAGVCRLIHVKDYRMVALPSSAMDLLAAGDLVAFQRAFTGDTVQFAELGAGNMNWPALLPAARAAGAEYFFIEQDEVYGRTPSTACGTAGNTCARSATEPGLLPLSPAGAYRLSITSIVDMGVAMERQSNLKTRNTRTSGKTRKSRQQVRDPLAPLEVVMTLLAALIIGGCLAVAVFRGLSNDVGFGLWGPPYPCIDGVPLTGLKLHGAPAGTMVGDLRPGVTTGFPRQFSLCQEHMSGFDRSLVSLPMLMDMLWTSGVVLVTLRVIKRARRHGLFTVDVARGCQLIGWVVLGGWLLVNVAGAILKAVAISHLVEGYPTTNAAVAILFANWNWSTLVAGSAALTAGRVMARTVALREEVEATV